jgi:hypothetical protein
VIYLVSIGDKMKKKILLPAVFLISFLFSGCFTFSSIKHYTYEFVNYKNKNVKKEKEGEWYQWNRWSSPEIIMEGVKFYFSLDGDGKQSCGRDLVMGSNYSPWIRIEALEGKYIDHVLINKVTVYVGETEYSMLERMSWVSIDLIDGYVVFNEEETLDVRRTGLIDHTVYTGDEYTFIETRSVYVKFFSVPIDFKKHKKIKILFDISVEYTTGEKIIINQELTGLLKIEREPNFWFPTV